MIRALSSKHAPRIPMMLIPAIIDPIIIMAMLAASRLRRLALFFSI